MRIIRVLAFLLLMPLTAFGVDLELARLSYISGNVQIYTDDTKEWVPASINLPLLEGDRLWTPRNARAEIQILGGLFVRLDARSSYDILALHEDSYQFYLNSGHVYINNRRGAVDHIQVDTPLSSIGCYDNSLAMIDVTESGATDVSVLKGYCYAETEKGKIRVPAGNTLRVHENLAAEILPIGPPDQWENWNLGRDRQLAEARQSLRYLPDELDEYAYDFDTYGRWLYVRDYGYCWTPTVVAAGWAPYRVGRWVWIAGNYVWISYDPWGWAPCHYGRWAFVANIGWCWVPPRYGSIYWSPGYVGWVHTPNYVAWVPLAPGERYYGYGNYGPLSVNITNVTVNKTVVRQEFRNIHVKNAVTIVNRNTFVSGRKSPIRVSGNPFLKKDVSFGPPTFKPTRTARMPVLRNIPRSEMPPPRVRKLSVPEIRRERGLVPEEKGSVFRPGRPAEDMKVIPRNQPAKVFREPAVRKSVPQRPSGPERVEKGVQTGRPSAGRPVTRGPEERQKPSAPVTRPQRVEMPGTPPGREKREIQPQPAPRAMEQRIHRPETRPREEVRKPSPAAVPKAQPARPSESVKRTFEKPQAEKRQQNPSGSAPETQHRRGPETKKPHQGRPEMEHKSF